MLEKNNRVDYLKKITVSLEMGTTENRMDLCSEPATYQFIYGAGSHGICLFEKALFGKQPGQTVSLPIESANAHEMFGHLTQSLIKNLPHSDSFFLQATVHAVDTVDNRDVIQAIAEGTGSCDCDCGCGC